MKWRLVEAASDRPDGAQLTAVSLFSGGGGLDLGFHRAGFSILAATDMDAASARTFELNWPGVPFIQQDIRRLDPEELVQACRGTRPDVIFGGPPCQGFCTLGDRLSGDLRNSLLEEFVRIVER